jgi:hypothetical protein
MKMSLVTEVAERAYDGERRKEVSWVEGQNEKEEGGEPRVHGKFW